MKKLATFFGLLKVHRFITLLFTGLAFSTGAFAASVTFNGTTNTDWATATNWSSGTVPASGDDISIAANKSVVIANGTIVNVQKITLNTGAGLTNYGTLTINPVSTTGAALNISGSNTFDNEGTLTVTTANQTSGTNAIYFLGTGNTLTFNGTSTLAAHSSANVFASGASATATIAGAGFTIGNATTNANFGIISLTSAGAAITISSGTTLNLYTGTGKNSIILANSASVINNGTINCYTTTTGAGLHAIFIWQSQAVNATFTNNGTLLMSGFEQPTVFGGGKGYSKFENTGTVTSIYPGISSGTSTGTYGIYSPSSLPNVITNSGTMNLNASYRSIYYTKASGGSFTNTGTINITKGIIAGDGTAGTSSTYQTIDNNSGGKINFNYGVSAGTTSATDKVIINNNSGATINGSCTFAASTLVTNAGSTLSPGDYTGGVSGIGKMIINTSGTFNLNGKVLMQVNGKTTAGTDYDQIQVTTSGSTLDVSGATLEMTVGGSYSPANDDAISLFTGATARTGNFSSVTLPSLNWSMDYATSTAAKVKYSSTPSTTISSGYNYVLSTNQSISDLTIASGGTLTVNAGKQLTISTTFSNSGTLNLLSSSADGTATILTPATISGSGATYNVQQYLGAARNWYVCSPISNATSPSTNITRYYEYVESGDNADFSVTGSTDYWKGLNTGTTMAVGKGYIAQASAGTTVQFSGTANNGNITTTFDLTRNDAKGKGFNLVGNPYPSYLDWVDVAAANSNLDNTYYYRTKNSTNGYTFVTWNGAGSSYVVSNGSLPVNTTVTRFIPPTQAFWVRVKSGTSSTAMNFTNTMREHRDDNGNLMKAPKQNTRTSVRLQLQNGTESDELLIYQDAAASNGYDAYDSPKMLNNSVTTPDLYTKAGDEKLVINGLQSITENMELPLGFSLNAPSTLKIKATELSNLPEGTAVYLLDKAANTQTELSPATEYSFTTTESTTNNESRFSVLFKAPGVTTGTTNTARDQVSVFVNTQNQITIIAKENSKYSIYNAVGQLIENGVINTERETRNTKQKAAGVYVVKVNNQSTRVILK